MPFILSSPAAPAPAASPGSRVLTRSADQDSVKTGSFGEAMARSREAGRERAVEPAIKPTPSKPVRRPADTEKSPVQDSVNPMAALLAAPLGNRLEATTTATAADAATAAGLAGAATEAIAAGVIAAGVATGAGSAGAATAAAIATTTVAISGGAVDTAGTAESPGIQVASERADLLPTAPAGPGGAPVTTAGSKDAQAAHAPALAQETSSRQGVLTASNLGIQAALAPALAVSVSKSADPVSVPVLGRTTPSSHVVSMTTDPLAVTTQAGAASAGLSEPSEGAGDDGAKSRATPSDRRVDLPLEAADTTPFSVVGGLATPASAALQQPGNASAPNATAPALSAIVLPDVGTSQWAKALGQQVIHLSTTDRQVAELQLNPPGLGPLKVTLSMNDQQMQASFISAHSSVRAAVESALPQLRAALAENGISLGQTSVGSESQPRNAFANGQSESGSQSPRSTYPARDTATAALFSAPAVAVQRRPGQGLRIDTYA